jgi:hypothetical protein
MLPPTGGQSWSMCVARQLFVPELHLLTCNLYDYLDPGEFDLVENVTVSSAFRHRVASHAPNNL